MRRRDVSPEELARIIRLRQIDTSWLQIGRDTGIPRRIAKRVYEEWGRNQSWEELKVARKDVAAEEFRNHLACLVKLAEFLVNAPDIPQPSHHPISGKEVLLSLWRNDIVGEYGAYGLPEVVPGVRRYPSETCLRQNRVLFESLKAHTHEKVDWKILDEWENTRDKCTRAQGKLMQEAHKMLFNVLNQKPGLIDKIVKESGKKDAMERMEDGLIHDAWQRILADKLAQPPLIQAMSRSDGMTEVVFGEYQLGLGLIFTEASLAKEVEDECHLVANNLGIMREKDMINLVNDVQTMRRAIDQLTEMLNPLMLRPLILRTRCDLCPA